MDESIKKSTLRQPRARLLLLAAGVLDQLRIPITLDRHDGFQFLSSAKRTNSVNNDNYYVKIGKKRRESSERNFDIISPRVILNAIITIVA